jgi:hypothetical protein
LSPAMWQSASARSSWPNPSRSSSSTSNSSKVAPTIVEGLTGPLLRLHLCPKQSREMSDVMDMNKSMIFTE